MTDPDEPDVNDLHRAGQLAHPFDAPQLRVVRDPGDDSDLIAQEQKRPPARERYRVKTARDLLGSAWMWATSEGPDRRVSFCNAEIDRLTGQMLPGDLTALLASMGFGKSSYLVMLADEHEQEGGRPLVLTAEDSTARWGRRLASRRAAVNALCLRDRELDLDSKLRLEQTCRDAEPHDMVISVIGWTIEDICEAVRRYVAEEGTPSFIALDYLQRIRSRQRMSDVERPDYVMGMFADLVKQLDVPGILISVVKRPEKGKDPQWTRPTMRDGRFAGMLEYMAENILVGFRERVEVVRGEPREVLRYISVDKAKDGPPGETDILMPWDSATASFRRVR